MEWFNVALLVILGIGLIVVEIIFVPGTTIVGVLGFVLVAVGVFLGFEYFGKSVGTVVLIAALAMALVTLVYTFRSRAWERFSLKSTSNSKVNDSEEMNLKIMDEGVAMSSLKPVGKAEFNNKEFEVVTQGNYVSSGTEVRIVKIDGKKIIVEPK